MAQKTGLVAIAVIVIVVIAAAAYLVTQQEEEEEEGEEKLKVAAVLPGSLTDVGWNGTLYEGLYEGAELYDFEPAHVEGVGQVGAGPYYIGFAEEGYDIIYVHAYPHKVEVAGGIAEDYPETQFIFTGGIIPESPHSNAIGIVIPLNESGYLAGILAAGITKTKKIGYIAGEPFGISIALWEMYRAGAYRVDSDVEAFSSYPGVWDDVTKGRETATALIELGCDVILTRGDGVTQGVIQACSQDPDVYAIGDMMDQNSLAPDTVISSIIWDLKTVNAKILELYRAGTLEGIDYFWGISEETTYLAPFHDLDDVVPQDTKDLLAQAEAEIRDGTLVLPYLEAEQPFVWVPGEVAETVTLSGTVTYADWTEGELVVEVYTQDPAVGYPSPYATGVFAEIGAWSIEVSVNTGEVWIKAFNDVDESGILEVGEASSYYDENPVTVGTEDISGIDFIPVVWEETVTLSGTVTYADWTEGGMVVDVYVGADPVPLWPASDYSATFAEMGAWSIEVPADLGEVWIAGFNDEDGDGGHRWWTSPTEPTGAYADNPVTVGVTDISGIDFTIAPE